MPASPSLKLVINQGFFSDESGSEPKDESEEEEEDVGMEEKQSESEPEEEEGMEELGESELAELASPSKKPAWHQVEQRR